MPRKFQELVDKMSPERRARIEARVQQTIEEMPLRDLRRALDLTQETIAETLQMSQGDVSKIERRTDMFISTVRNYLHAMNAELDIVARFADGRTVRINQFRDLETPEEKLATEADKRTARGRGRTGSHAARP